MCADWKGSRGEDPEGEAPPLDVPDGPRPYGSRPYGSRPYGSRPYGSRPYGSRPYGSRPYGSRPYGSRPYGSRPYGSRPYGSRPYGSREDEPDGFLDPAEWSADIADIFCDCSVVVRLGARIVADEEEIPVPAIEHTDRKLGYLRQRPITGPGDESPPKRWDSENKPQAILSQRILKPRDHELALTVVLPNRLVRDVIEYPEVGWALKEDLAQTLALRADAAFLSGVGDPEPVGISKTAQVNQVPEEKTPDDKRDVLKTVRAIVRELRTDTALFRNPGWVLHPQVLAELTAFLTDDSQKMPPKDAAGRSLDATRLLTYDGFDGGDLVGYPFLVSRAAGAEHAVFFRRSRGRPPRGPAQRPTSAISTGRSGPAARRPAP